MLELDSKWQKRFERERKSRKEAERLLEEKSHELYELNQSLEKRIDSALKKNKEQENLLAEQSKLASMGEMIKNIAHQWRQPLSAITSSSSSVQLQMELGLIDNTEINKTLSEIIEKANYLSNTIEDFRNYFKSDNQKVDFNIVDAIKNIEHIMESTYFKEHIILIDKLPNEEIIFHGLPGELSQVILNIFNNSCDAFIKNEIDEKIVIVNLILDNNKLYIKVQDNAGGIEDDTLPKVFEPYFTTKHQSQGAGIGLYMCSEIIKNHFHGQMYISNETMKYDNKEYKGVCITIELALTGSISIDALANNKKDEA